MTFPKMEGLGKDVFSLQCEDTPNSKDRINSAHWMYEDNTLVKDSLHKFNEYYSLIQLHCEVRRSPRAAV